MPPRLYYWLALAGTTATIGFGLLANHMGEAALGAFASAFLLVLVGGIAELFVPYLRWQFGDSGKCDRAIRGRIKLGQSLLKQPVASQDECTHWDALTQQVLRRYFGGDWHPEFQQYMASDATHSWEDARRTAIARKLDYLQDLRSSLQRREAVLVPNQKVRTS
jgi:hypothetical protein